MFVKFDSAFDTTNRVYLVVWGTQATGPVNGIFLNEAGTPVGAVFAISDGAQQSGWARVIYSATEGKFLVSYVKILAVNYHQKIARFVTYSGGTGSLGPEIPLDTWSGGAGNETGIAYSAPSRRFFVTWWRQQGAFPASYVATLDASGTILNSQLLTNLSDGQSDPEIACDPVNRRCFVSGWSWGVFNGGKTAIWGRFIDDTLGNPQGADSFYLPATGYLEEPTVTFSTAGSRFVVAVRERGADLREHRQRRRQFHQRVVPVDVQLGGDPLWRRRRVRLPDHHLQQRIEDDDDRCAAVERVPGRAGSRCRRNANRGLARLRAEPGGGTGATPWDLRSKYVIPVANPVTQPVPATRQRLLHSLPRVAVFDRRHGGRSDADSDATDATGHRVHG